MKVNGVAGQIPLRPAPVEVFEDKTWIGGQDKIAGFAWDELDVGVGGMAAQVPEVQGN